MMGCDYCADYEEEIKRLKMVINDAISYINEWECNDHSLNFEFLISFLMNGGE